MVSRGQDKRSVVEVSIGIKECRDDQHDHQGAKDVASNPRLFVVFVKSAFGHVWHDVLALPSRQNAGCVVPSGSAEDAAEYRVDMLGVIAEIELLADFLFR